LDLDWGFWIEAGSPPKDELMNERLIRGASLASAMVGIGLLVGRFGFGLTLHDILPDGEPASLASAAPGARFSEDEAREVAEALLIDRLGGHARRIGAPEPRAAAVDAMTLVVFELHVKTSPNVDAVGYRSDGKASDIWEACWEGDGFVVGADGEPGSVMARVLFEDGTGRLRSAQTSFRSHEVPPAECDESVPPRPPVPAEGDSGR
jgi:hypothetical protein